MNSDEKLQLQKMISANNVTDQTGDIRRLKHSVQISKDVINLSKLVKSYANIPNSDNTLNNEAMSKCPFLHKNYPLIYNKLLRSELDLHIMFNFLHILGKIEEGEIDQHMASFEVGKLLKKLFVDSALKRANLLDEENNVKGEELVKPVSNLSYADFKKMNNQDTSTTQSQPKDVSEWKVTRQKDKKD